MLRFRSGKIEVIMCVINRFSNSGVLSGVRLLIIPAILTLTACFESDSGEAKSVAITANAVTVESQQLLIQPQEGLPGQMLNIDGSGFLNSPCGVFLNLDDLSGPFLGSASLSDGAFSTSVIIPTDTTPGNHEVIASGRLINGEFCGGPSGDEASARLIVLQSQTRLDYKVYLRNRVFLPILDEDFLNEVQTSGTPIHGIVQLNQLPSVDGDIHKELQAMGIRLLEYLNGMNGIGTAYLALLTPPIDNQFRTTVRGLERILPGDKLPVDFAMMNGVDTVDALVRIFKDVDPATVPEIFSNVGIKAEQRGDSQHWVTQATVEQLIELTLNDSVQWVEKLSPFQPELDTVRAVSNVDPVQDLNTNTGVYNGLSGSGVQIAIMDSGVDDQHNDFNGRIIRSQDDSASHGSHVAGIAVGSGFQSDTTDNNGNPNNGTPFQWRGMAPGAEIAAYGGAQGNPANFDDAINNFGVDVSNHSYAVDATGAYGSEIASIDEIIRGDSPGIPARPASYSAGNGGSSAQYGMNLGYFALTKTCKNCMIVANVTGGSIHAGGSSMGPTSDGRLKPDISAVGSSVRSVASDTFAGVGNGYRTSGGTSMASPVITGIMGLMLEQYANTFAVDLDVDPPLPSTLKAIMLQTAIDLAGTDPTINPDTGNPVNYGAGPDWATGYGLADASAAVDLIVDQTFLEDLVSAGDHTDSHAFTVSEGEIRNRITLAWDDVAGSPNANNAAAQLVNDLDLIVVDPDGIEYQPLVLPLLTPGDCDGDNTNGIQVGTCAGFDPAGQNYFGPAAPGTDRRNNVEQVVLENTDGLTPGNWSAVISVLNDDGITVRLPLGGDQPYSLVLDNNNPPLADAGPDQLLECEGPSGNQVSLDGSASSDPDDDELTYSWTGSFVEGGGTTNGVNPTVTMMLGDNTATLTVMDTSDAFDTDDVSVTIEDTTPPEIDSLTADPESLWPPNHKIVSVVTEVSVIDVCDNNVQCQIIEVTSNQPVDGLGDGSTEPDWEITGDLTVELRAERSGLQENRIYTITVQCMDASDNEDTKSVTVTVPHNMGN
jgi:subtilisin family serine protease